MRLFLTFIILSIAVLVPFLAFGGTFESAFTTEGTIRWLEERGREHGWWMGLLLLASDLLLPIPSTAVMSGLGYVYGTGTGGVVAAAGTFLSGMAGYGVCRLFGERAVSRLLGARDRERGERLFAGPAGGWLVALSRCFPVLPEVVSCMAGLVRMPLRSFMPSLAAGSAAMGFLFAAIGSSGMERPWLALALSVAVPAVLYAIVAVGLRRLDRR